MQDARVVGSMITAAARAATGSDLRRVANSAESGSDMAVEPTPGTARLKTGRAKILGNAGRI
jgi:hypothetical protein